jgi:hypothetical protein
MSSNIPVALIYATSFTLAVLAFFAFTNGNPVFFLAFAGLGLLTYSLIQSI